MRLGDIIADIKRQKSPAARFIYRVGKKVRRVEIPAPKLVFLPILTTHDFATGALHKTRERLFYQPAWRARCESCGPGLVVASLPFIQGPLRVRLGRDCWIESTTFASSSLLEAPTLTVGDHTFIGHGVTISVAQSVSLGSHVKIAGGCYICDNSGHPMDAVARRERGVTLEDIKPVVIEDDVWLGTRVVVLPGVRIGRGTVVGAGSVVTKDLPAYSLAAGNPARVVRALDTAEATEHARNGVLNPELMKAP